MVEFNQRLLSWLAESSADTLGGSRDEVVLTFPIGGVTCTLRGDTTRAGVAAYLDTFLTAPSGPFSVVASRAGVVHRVAPGVSGERVPGFYLYTDAPFEEPGPLGVPGVSEEFDLLDVARLILESVAELHSRGHQLLRVYPGMAASGMYWRTSIGAAGDDDSFRYTTGDEFDVAGMQVSATTTSSQLADAILGALPDPGIGSDWAYAGWFIELLGLCRRHGAVPIAYADYYDLDPAWEIGWGSGVTMPPPPANR